MKCMRVVIDLNYMPWYGKLYSTVPGVFVSDLWIQIFSSEKHKIKFLGYLLFIHDKCWNHMSCSTYYKDNEKVGCANLKIFISLRVHPKVFHENVALRTYWVLIWWKHELITTTYWKCFMHNFIVNFIRRNYQHVLQSLKKWLLLVKII